MRGTAQGTNSKSLADREVALERREAAFDMLKLERDAARAKLITPQ